MLRDPNHNALTSLDSFNVVRAVPTAFDGGTADARGNDGGANDPFTLFTVTGDVIVRLYGVCTTDLAGATATIEVGVTGNTAELLAQSTATDIDANEIWVDATVDDVRAATFADVIGPTLIVNGSDIIESVGTANVTQGQIYYVCLWRPISPDGNVTTTHPKE